MILKKKQNLLTGRAKHTVRRISEKLFLRQLRGRHISDSQKSQLKVLQENVRATQVAFADQQAEFKQTGFSFDKHAKDSFSGTRLIWPDRLVKVAANM